MKLPPSVPPYFQDEERIVKWLSQLTNKSPQLVHSRLLKEYDNPGINVSDAMHQSGLEPHIWNDKLTEFYSQTDAFLYELIVWNLNKRKRRMRRRIGKYLDKNLGQHLNILTVGDGLGVDSIYLTRAGHNVTYIETSAYAQAFAKKLFADYAKDINILDDPNQISKNAYDVVICLDVLEHVPDPHEFVKTITSYIKSNGHLIIHAPFYQIHPSTPTHLKSNRKYSGSLRLYEKHGLKLVYGALTWDPITLKKITDRKTEYPSFKPRLLALRLAGLYLALGRFTILPFLWIKSYQLKGRRWFNES
jgi:2-polyprenyl-3-methyl-5-hydroxy-6-metoxy-1,4-benzoquinol methylase